MKRILSVLLALTLVLSLSLTSFAAVTITHSFRALDENGEEYVYHFGTFDKVNDKEVGLVVGNNEYKLDDAAYEKAVTAGGKFGIGLIDKNNVYGGQYTVTPYSKAEIGGERTEYASKDVVENDYKITFNEPQLPLSANGSLEVNSDGSYKKIDASYTTGKKNGSTALSLGTQKAAYLTFDISNLKGINDDKLITITFTNYRQGANLGQYIYMYGMTSENKIETINEEVISGKYNVAYDAAMDNQANTPMTATFNVTNYIKNKLINGEKTATFVYVLKSETVNLGYLAYQGKDLPALNYVSKDAYAGEDKNEEFVPFYAEKEITVSEMLAIANQTNSFDGDAISATVREDQGGWTTGGVNFLRTYATGSNRTTDEETVALKLNLNGLKGLASGRKIKLNFGLRRSAPSSTNSDTTQVAMALYGTTSEDSYLYDAENLIGTVNDFDIGVMSVQEKTIDITEYVKEKIDAKENTATIVFRVRRTGCTDEAVRPCIAVLKTTLPTVSYSD